MYEVLMAILASVLYMLLYWLPKRIDTIDPEKIDPKKVIRTLLWGLVIGLALAYWGIEPNFENIRLVFSRLLGYGAVIAFVDKSTLFIYRIAKKLKEKYA